MPANHRYSVQTALIIVACSLLGACSSSASSMSTSAINPVNWITPYKVDVIQGNFISKEQVEQLRAGLSRDEVKAVLGTPLMSSLFHADRWDYVFTMKRQGVESQSFKYTVFFKDNLLERFEGDAMPSEADFISRLSNQRKLGKVPPLEATEAQLKAAEKAPAIPPNTTTAAAPEPSAAVYPPLESSKQ
ncbi:MAG: outer membrane protein assembly factor BamE [Polaromonas sp.]